MATTTKPRAMRVVKDDDKPTKEPPLVIQLPPDVFARAQVNLRAIAKMSTVGAWWLEWVKDQGAWLVTAGGSIVAAAWVPEDPATIERVPGLDVEPDRVICYADPDGRINNLCDRLLKAYGGKDSLAPGLDQYLQWRPGVKVDGKQLTFAEMEAPAVSVWSEGERHDATGMEIPPVQWRSKLRTFEHVPRDGIQLAAEAVKVFGSFRGYRPTVLEFGSGSTARFTLTADVGDWPTVLGAVDIGRRSDATTGPTEPNVEPEPSPETGDLPALVQPTYDIAKDEWGVNEDWSTEGETGGEE